MGLLEWKTIDSILLVIWIGVGIGVIIVGTGIHVHIPPEHIFMLFISASACRLLVFFERNWWIVFGWSQFSTALFLWYWFPATGWLEYNIFGSIQAMILIPIMYVIDNLHLMPAEDFKAERLRRQK